MFKNLWQKLATGALLALGARDASSQNSNILGGASPKISCVYASASGLNNTVWLPWTPLCVNLLETRVCVEQFMADNYWVLPLPLQLVFCAWAAMELEQILRMAREHNRSICNEYDRHVIRKDNFP